MNKSRKFPKSLYPKFDLYVVSFACTFAIFRTFYTYPPCYRMPWTRLILAIVPEPDKCLDFLAFLGVILCKIQSFSSLRIYLNYRHLSSCDTIVYGRSENHKRLQNKIYRSSSSTISHSHRRWVNLPLDK